MSFFGGKKHPMLCSLRLNRCLGMQNAAESNVPLPIGLNNRARFTGTGVTSACKNAAQGERTLRAKKQLLDNRQYQRHGGYHVNKDKLCCLSSYLMTAGIGCSTSTNPNNSDREQDGWFLLNNHQSLQIQIPTHIETVTVGHGWVKTSQRTNVCKE